jgi:hypothetical protein
MPIDVRGPDGTIYRVNTDDEQVARRTVRSRLARTQQETEARQRSGDPRVPGSVAGAMAGAAIPSRQAVNQGRERSVARMGQRLATLPFGGPATFDTLSAIGDPARRRDLMNRGAGFVRDVQQIPSLNFGRLAQDTANAAGEGLRNLPETAGNIVQNLPQIAWEATGAPVVRQENALQRMDIARAAGNRGATQQFASQANTALGQQATNAGGIFSGSVIRTPLQAAGAGAALSAPGALGRNPEQPLQERLPGALTEIGGVAGFGAGAQALANGLPSLLRRPSQGNQRAADFEAAGVRPTMAAVNGGTSAGITKMIGENFLGGIGVRARLQASIDDASAAVSRMASEAGEVAPREIVGEGIQGRVREFARDRNMPNPRPGVAAADVPTAEWSLPAKSEAIYGDVFGQLSRDEAAYISGNTAEGLLSVSDTMRTLDQIETRISGAASREQMNSPFVTRMRAALEADAADGSLRFQDLRAWRTHVREAQIDDALRMGTSEAQLQRIEQALTADIYRSADEISPGAAADLRAADAWYARESNLIKNVLRQFQDRPGFGGAQAYQRMIALATQGGQQNSRQLQQALEVLPRASRRSISATLIDELGNPSFGASNALEAGAFSIDRFVTNYARLSPDGRRALFGDLTEQLDTLARVGGYQKGVEAMANRSRSGVNAQNFTTGLLFLNPASRWGAVAGIIGGAITGEMLTNPAFVRWLTSAPKNGDRAGMRRHLTELSRLAARDPALGAVAAEYQAQLEGQQLSSEPASNGGPASRPPQREPAFR